jgi:hypothetical protein
VVQPSKINLAELAGAAASILPSNSWNSSRVRSGDGLDILLPPAEARTANRQLRDDLLARVDMESVRRCRHEIDVDDDDLPMTGFTQCRHISSPAAVRIAVVNARPQIARCAPWRVVRNRSGMDSEAERRDRPTSVVTSSLNFCAHVLEATKHVSHTDNGRA